MNSSVNSVVLFVKTDIHWTDCITDIQAGYFYFCLNLIQVNDIINFDLDSLS